MRKSFVSIILAIVLAVPAIAAPPRERDNKGKEVSPIARYMRVVKRAVKSLSDLPGPPPPPCTGTNC